MGEVTKIGWCRHTWSPWRGCAKVSPGCLYCYAEKGSHRNPAVLGYWGKGKPRVTNMAWHLPMGWHRRAKREGRRATVFPSWCDPFDMDASPLVRARFLDLIRPTDGLMWLLLTKRSDPGDFRQLMKDARELAVGVSMPTAVWIDDWLNGNPPENVAIGVSIENQDYVYRAKDLREIPTRYRFISAEPLLGPLTDFAHLTDWVIFGGESGANARPCEIDWIRDGVRQCREAKTPLFVKQLGARPLVRWPMAGDDGASGLVEVKRDIAFTDASGAARGTVKAFQDSKGGEPDEWPEDLRIQQFPEFAQP